MIIDDYWWLLMIIGDYWWLLMIIDWKPDIDDDWPIYKNILLHHDYWRFMVTEDYWWLTIVPCLLLFHDQGWPCPPGGSLFFYVWWTRLDGKFSLIFFNENHGTTAVPIWFGIPLGGSSNPFLEGDLRRFQAFWWKIPQATGLVVMMEHFFGGKLQHMKYHLVMTNIAMV